MRLGAPGFPERRPMRGRLVGGVAALLLAWSATVTVAQVATGLGPKDGAGLSPTDLGQVAVGRPTPDFTLESKDGGPSRSRASTTGRMSCSCSAADIGDPTVPLSWAS